VTFSGTFEKGTDATPKDFLKLLGIIFGLIIFLMVISWLILGCMLPKDIGLRIMGFYGCHHKTVAMGLPLINAIYEEDPKIGMYALPLLVWHPA